MTDSTNKSIVADVYQAMQSAYRVFTTKYTSMKENADFLKLDQYTDDQLSKMEANKLVPYVFDYITNGVNTHLGIQRDQGTEIFYYPNEQGDDLNVEVLNAVKDYVLRMNRFALIESSMFQYGLVEGVGAVGYEWDTINDPIGLPRVFPIRPRQCMWDLNAMEYGATDASWVTRHRIFTKREMKARRPEEADRIDKMSFTEDLFAQLRITDSGFIRELQPGGLENLVMVEFFEKTFAPRYFLQAGRGDILEASFTTKQAARDMIERFRTEILSVNPNAQLPEMNILTRRVPRVLRTEIVNEHPFADQEEMPEGFIPISFFMPYWHDGDWWSYVDTMKDPQRYFNKMMMMVDNWIGKMSKGLLLIDDNTPKKESDEVIQRFSTTGGAMRVKNPDAYTLIESKGPAPQLFAMGEVAKQILEEKAGGRNFMGKKETAAESGVAVRQRVQQGALTSYVMFDNLSHTKHDIGTKLLWYMTNLMTMPQTVRIMGEELTQYYMKSLQQGGGNDWFNVSKTKPGVGYLEVNTVSENTIEKLKADVVIGEARFSQSRSEHALAQINIAMQSNPMMAQSFDPMAIIELLPIPFTQKLKAKQRTQQLLEMNMKQKQQEIDAKAAPRLTADLGDIEKMPTPEGMVQVAALFGIQLDIADIPDLRANEEMRKSVELKTKVANEVEKRKNEKLKIEAATAQAAQKKKDLQKKQK